MKRIITGLAMLAALGSSMTAAGPVFAQGGKIDCSDPRMAAMYCQNKPKPNAGQPGRGEGNNGGQRHTGGGDNNNQNPFVPGQGTNNGPQVHHGNNNNNNNNNDGNFNNNDNFNNNHNGPPRGRNPDFGPAPGMGPGPGMGHPDRNQFRNHFRPYHYRFPRPDFPIRPGYPVPRYYDLRPLPPALFAFYPFYRGYLFFETADGTIVIVDPRTYRIVAIF